MDAARSQKDSEILLPFDEYWEKLKADVLADFPEEEREDLLNSMLGLAAFN